MNFNVSPNANLIIADDVSAGVRVADRNRLCEPRRNDGRRRHDQPDAFSFPIPTRDVFGGLIAGTGQFIMDGFGNFTTGSINFQGAGGITAASGSLQVNGTISAGSLLVNSHGDIRRTGNMVVFRGPLFFNRAATFLVTLNGTAARKPVHPARRHRRHERGRISDSAPWRPRSTTATRNRTCSR